MVNRSAESSYTRWVEISSQVEEMQKLLKQLKKHKRKWLTFKHVDGFCFAMAISVAIVILKNARFGTVKIKDHGGSPLIVTIQSTKDKWQCILQSEEEKTHQQPKMSFIEALPTVSRLINEILDLTEDNDTRIIEAKKDQVLDCMMRLVGFARTKNLVDFNKFKPQQGKKTWQHDRLVKSLDTIT
ncbi:MAG: hypothetical protein OXC46_04435 [Thaumarchaeota archaeon]|nr:hypothetical protein [Nitrososphaerota archaeon]